MAEEHQLLKRQKAFVLLQVFMGPDRRLKQSELPRKFTRTILRDLGPLLPGSEKNPVVDKPALEAIRDDLVQGGYLQRSKQGRTPYLQLTEKGAALLFSYPQYHSVKFTMSGEGLTSLLESQEELLIGQKAGADGANFFAAKAQMKSICAETLRGLQGLFAEAQRRVLAVLEGTSPMPTTAALPPTSSASKPEATAAASPQQSAIAPRTDAELKAEILAAFDYLLQEKYTQGAMVPIHAVRRRVADRLGEEAASHALFDPAVQQLGKQQKVRLVSISDRRDVTDEEINASIPGANETLFYLKAAHEHVHA